MLTTPTLFLLSLNNTDLNYLFSVDSFRNINNSSLVSYLKPHALTFRLPPLVERRSLAWHLTSSFQISAVLKEVEQNQKQTKRNKAGMPGSCFWLSSVIVLS